MLKKAGRAGLIAAMLLCMTAWALPAHAQDSTITYELSGDKEGNYYTSDITLSYEVEDDDGISETTLTFGSETLFDETWENETSVEGEFEITEDWLSKNEPSGHEFEMKLTAEDVNGEETVKNITFKADTSEPKINLSGITDKEIYKEDKTVKVTLQDKNVSSADVTLHIKKGDEEVYKSTEPDTINGYEFKAAEDGEYTISVKLTDKGGHEVSEKVSFIIDKTAPSIEGVTINGGKNDGSEWYNDDMRAKAGIKDGLSGIKKIDIILNGNNIYSKTYTGNNSEDIDQELSRKILTESKKSDGSYELQIQAIDVAGNKGTETINFFADVIAPTITINGATDGTSVNSAPTIIAKASDDIGAKVIATIKKDGGEAETETADDGTFHFTPSEDGAYIITAYAVDAAENASDEVKVTFNFDTKAPDIKDLRIIGERQTGYTWYPSDVSATGEAADTLSGIERIQISVNGESVYDERKDGDLSATVTKDIVTSWITTHQSSDGSYSVTIKVTDAAGNSSEKTEVFYADTTTPEVVLTGAKDGEYTNKSKTIDAKIKSTFGGVVDLTVTRNGKTVFHEADKEESTFTVTEDGTYVVTARAINHAGTSSNTEEITYYYDTVKPDPSSIGISGDRNDGYTWYKGSVKAASAVSDDFSGLAQVKMQVNGKSVLAKDMKGALSYALSETLEKNWFRENESENGVYEVVITAEDRAGNEASVKAEFHADVVSPSVSIGGIKEGTYTRSNPSISSRVTDNYPSKNTIIYQVYRDKKLIKTIRKGGSSASIRVFSKDGDYTVRVSAVDKAGNTAKIKRLNFTHDTIAPVLSLTGASNNQYYNTAKSISANIKERNYKNMTVKSTVERVLDGKKYNRTLGQIRPNKMNYTKVSRFSVNGTYLVTLTAVDKAGNKAKPVKLAFTVDTEKPEVKITGFKELNGYGDTVAPKIVYSDSYYKSKTVKLQRATGKDVKNITFREAKTKKGGSVQYNTFDTERKTDDIYVLTCSVTDKAGNVTTKKETFTIDRYGSTFTISKGSKALNRQSVKEMDDSVSIIEVNPASIKKAEGRLSIDGSQVDANVKVKKDTAKNGWARVTYTYPAEVFDTEGVYELDTYSVDAASNTSSFTGNTDNEFKVYIDRTAPVITVSGVEQGGRYDISEAVAHVTVKDNIKVAGYKVASGSMLENELYNTEGEDVPETAEITLSEGNNQTITIIATDTAGNESRQEITDVTVSGSAITRTFSNMKAVAAGTLATVLAIAAAVFMLARRKRS